MKKEAIPAGGLGPAEGSRLETRHLADSLIFLAGWPLIAPREVWDLGSGVGLPGIPLAIVNPESRFVLIDRSERRVRLMRRALRVLQLENAWAEQKEIGSLIGEPSLIVSRATASAGTLTPTLKNLLEPGGRAVLGGSWVKEPKTPPGWELVTVRSQTLDQAVWLLIMHADAQTPSGGTGQPKGRSR